jgi:hypothetical protein
MSTTLNMKSLAIAAESTSTKAYDLLILVDATYSMSNYLRSLNSSLPRIISLSSLTKAFERIGLLAYRDYCDKDLIDWSGWLDLSKPASSQPDIIGKAATLKPLGGGDYPEATKTGLAKAFEVMRPDATTIILLYTDAPPHMNDANSEYFQKEQRALKASKDGKLFMDWTSACRNLRKTKMAQVFSILEPNMKPMFGRYYNYLSETTNGACFYLNNSQSTTISKVTMDILLAWMGIEKVGSTSTVVEAKLQKYKNPQGLRLANESSLPKSDWFKTDQIEIISLTSDILKANLPKRDAPVQDFAKKYASDKSYKQIVTDQLKKIISEDVSAISLNPVFGSLWRAVCNDRESLAREELTQCFSMEVEKIKDLKEKTRMKEWLAESYNYTAEVMEAISKVPKDRLFPCAYLDPTLRFETAKDLEDGEENRPITAFTRNELLEIGRSCDSRILRRLSRVITRLSFAKSPEDLPVHIVKADEEDLIRIPLALAHEDFGCRFWKILLHVVVPGTLLSSRPAALLAALTIKLGIQPLLDVANQEMLSWRNNWCNLDIPETWNASCLSLLSDADDAFKMRHSDSVEEASVDDMEGLLTSNDRELFDRLVSYKMLELNLATVLNAKVGWRPEKAAMRIGPLVHCNSCGFPRSVTMMAGNGVCGLCIATYTTSEERKERISSRVSKKDNKHSTAIWVECSMHYCRAQYVVYNPHELNVRPKCFYCRTQPSLRMKNGEAITASTAPCVECHICLNRMIWPIEYRKGNLEKFICIACSSDQKSILDVETSATCLREENGTNWLLKIENNRIIDPFNGRSLFHTISAVGTVAFCDEVILFPNGDQKLKLFMNGKSVHNAEDVRMQLKSWVIARHVESGDCSLCFNTNRKSLLLPACGRTGCLQKVCTDCLQGWYGLNAPGRIINTSALACPFCRRAPTAKTLARYGLGIHYVGNLRAAVENSGEWIYAWCSRCSHAKAYMERSCAAGAPMDVENWICEGCSILGHNELELKHCPGCGVLTEKIDGCDHIECTVLSCQVHWCFFCGVESTAENIYQHMEVEHGGYYNG